MSGGEKIFRKILKSFCGGGFKKLHKAGKRKIIRFHPKNIPKTYYYRGFGCAILYIGKAGQGPGFFVPQNRGRAGAGKRLYIEGRG